MGGELKDLLWMPLVLHGATFEQGHLAECLLA